MRAPSRSKRSGSRRKSTSSVSSCLTSSRPATSSKRTNERALVSTAVGLIFGISSIVRQTRKTIAPKKTSGSQMINPFGGLLKKFPQAAHAMSIGRRARRLERRLGWSQPGGRSVGGFEVEARAKRRLRDLDLRRRRLTRCDAMLQLVSRLGERAGELLVGI